MVRLEVNNVEMINRWNYDFNSKMVRLEVIARRRDALVAKKFQFQNGTIRSVV